MLSLKPPWNERSKIDAEASAIAAVGQMWPALCNLRNVTHAPEHGRAWRQESSSRATVCSAPQQPISHAPITSSYANDTNRPQLLPGCREHRPGSICKRRSGSPTAIRASKWKVIAVLSAVNAQRPLQRRRTQYLVPSLWLWPATRMRMRRSRASRNAASLPF